MSAAEPLVPLELCDCDSLADWEIAARAAVGDRLKEILDGPAAATRLLGGPAQAACLGRGKRVRPLLAMLAAEHFGGAGAAALNFGCAVEMAHCASLILDDLPCMDDASMRRGRPAIHRSFGEATAVLTAVALLNEAYSVIAGDEALPADLRLTLQQLLTGAVGFQGLAAGQARDLFDGEGLRDEPSLASLNHQKTGVLFVTVLQGGAAIAGASAERQRSAAAFAQGLGLAFQILDDLHDVTSTLQVLGKDARQDAGRTTFVSLWGVEESRRRLTALVDAALAEIGAPEAPLARYALGLFQQAGYRAPA